MKYTDENDIELTDISDIQVYDRTKPGIFQRIAAWLRGEDLRTEDAGEYELNRALSRKQRQEIRDALQKWKDAVAYFENVDDPELIEYAVYEMEAAKRRYIFLLKNSHMI
jgi:hypothetical protein